MLFIPICIILPLCSHVQKPHNKLLMLSSLSPTTGFNEDENLHIKWKHFHLSSLTESRLQVRSYLASGCVGREETMNSAVSVTKWANLRCQARSSCNTTCPCHKWCLVSVFDHNLYTQIKLQHISAFYCMSHVIKYVIKIGPTVWGDERWIEVDFCKEIIELTQ